MTWLAALILAALYLALMLRVAYWLGGLLAEAEIFFERETSCTCRKGGWMPTCPVHGRQAA